MSPDYRFKLPYSTVGKALTSILPLGTMPSIENNNSDDVLENSLRHEECNPNNWEIPPAIPTDVFAAVAHLIHMSGLLNYYDPNPEIKEEQNRRSFGIKFFIKKDYISTGEKWSIDADNDEVYTCLEKYWDVIFAAWGDPLRASMYERDNGNIVEIPNWWRAAMALLIISDEACVGLGSAKEVKDERWVVSYFHEQYKQPLKKENKLGDGRYKIDRLAPSFSDLAASDIACIMPKLRVSGVGCTLKNLTKNVAYIASAGAVRCHWQQPEYTPASEDASFLKILLCPLPFEMEDGCFSRVEDVSPTSPIRENWGNFKINQNWLSEDKNKILIKNVCEIVKKANQNTDKINAIVFPEFSLTEELFSKICEKVKAIAPELEFIIAGTSDNCEGAKANFVLTAIWGETGEDFLMTSRRKHHRWRLDRGQLKNYRLDKIFHGDKVKWWEEHEIGQRELHFFKFRKSSVFTSMICEDLARNDPCHEILRSIGPNLMFALLMDSAQIPERWSSRYATSLTDDPGISSLTFTSKALVKRMNDYIEEKGDSVGKLSDSIALWSDEEGNRIEIDIEEGSFAVLLTLESDITHDQTIDNRSKDNRFWKYNNHEQMIL